jgi:hypothetical protein
VCPSQNASCSQDYPARSNELPGRWARACSTKSKFGLAGRGFPRAPPSCGQRWRHGTDRRPTGNLWRLWTAVPSVLGPVIRLPDPGRGHGAFLAAPCWEWPARRRKIEFRALSLGTGRPWSRACSASAARRPWAMAVPTMPRRTVNVQQVSGHFQARHSSCAPRATTIALLVEPPLRWSRCALDAPSR